MCCLCAAAAFRLARSLVAAAGGSVAGGAIAVCSANTTAMTATTRMRGTGAPGRGALLAQLHDGDGVPVVHRDDETMALRVVGHRRRGGNPFGDALRLQSRS